MDDNVLTRRQFLQVGLGLFANAVSTSLLCGARRACLMTRRYPTVTGVVESRIKLPREEIGIAEQFGDHGYNPFCGYAISIFADSYSSARTRAYPRLAAEGWLAVALVVPTTIGGVDKLTEEQCTALNRAGWDIASHGYTHEDPTLMTPEELDDHLNLSQQWLLARGYTQGARHYGPPIKCNQAVRDAAVAYYHTVIPGGLGPWAVLPDGPTYTWQPAHDDIAWATVQTALDALVNDPGAVVMLVFHDVVPSRPKPGQTSVARLQRTIDYIKAQSINVVNMSQLLDGEVPMHRIFADGFESGDLSAWDRSIGTPTVSAAAALVGGYGCEIDVGSGNEAVEDRLTLTQRYRVQGRVNPSNLSRSPGASTALFVLRQGTYPTGVVRLGYNGAAFTLLAGIRDDAGTWHNTAAYPITTEVHFVEADFFFDAAGHVELWIDGVSKEKISGITCGTRGVDSCRFGRIGSSGTISGILYIDQFISDRANYIGA